MNYVSKYNWDNIRFEEKNSIFYKNDHIVSNRLNELIAIFY